ncbi:F0F1 ATP synthase subunit A [Flavobacterium sp. xlx-214]|uniref:F0F1 ATP synthase subunit A n=1 Tax=unclassified Flavobacterium TaxID=196869 RepID=UPI0013D007FC|nr:MULTISPECIES: F0F1 ATP synthase subunit A [unclassified Flavobacterium]MBA5791704.1 F0F1 ATP synthase subunit A [Flavobacterium sp. xlx-221]QMI82945.1 F0F1 ATP synthase subunit A [Flavobacterium sp. xlx-214]
MKYFQYLIVVFLLFFSFNIFGHNEKSTSKKIKINETIEHHLLDDYYFTLFKDEKEERIYGFPLPVIILDDGLKIFSSSEFINGDKIASYGDHYYVLDHNKIYKSDKSGNKLLFGEKFIKPLDFSITKSVVGLIFIAMLMFVLFVRLANSYKKDYNRVPNGIGRLLEPLILYVRDEIAKPNIGEKYKQYMPFLLSVFFLIWILNIIGLTPFGFNITGNISVTFCLALFTLILVNIKGTKSYWKHIFWMPGVPYSVRLILMPIEVLGIFTKGISLMIRLYANNMAGHTVIMGLIAIIFLLNEELTIGGSIGVSLILTLFIYIIKILAAFLQAYIFTILSALFIGQSVEEHNH